MRSIALATFLIAVKLAGASPVLFSPIPSPKTSSNSLITRSPPRDNTCTNIGTSGIAHEDCEIKPGHEFEADGSCRVWPSDGCKAYCEWFRYGYHGHPVSIDNSGGKKGLEEGISVSVTQSINVNIGAAFSDLVSMGVSFEWTTTKTSTKTWKIDPDTNLTSSPTRRTEWVYFPIMITTCGIVTEKEKKTYSAAISVCPGTYFCSVPKAKDPTCEGNPKNTKDVCSTTPKIDENGHPSVDYVQRYVNLGGYPLPLDEQPEAYVNYCTTSKTADGSPLC